MKKTASLSKKFFILTILPTIVISIVVAVIYGSYLKENEQQRYYSVLVNFLSIQSKVISIYVWNYNDSGIHESLKAILTYPGITRAKVVDINGDVLYAQMNEKDIKNVADINLPIFYATPLGNKKIAELVVSVDYENAIKGVDDDLPLYVLVIFTLFLSTIVFGMLALRTLITNPLNNLLLHIKTAKEKKYQRTHRHQKK